MEVSCNVNLSAWLGILLIEHRSELLCVQQHVKEEDLSGLELNSIDFSSVLCKSTKDFETADQETKKFMHFHKDVMQPTFSINRCQWK